MDFLDIVHLVISLALGALIGLNIATYVTAANSKIRNKAKYLIYLGILLAIFNILILIID